MVDTLPPDLQRVADAVARAAPRAHPALPADLGARTFAAIEAEAAGSPAPAHGARRRRGALTLAAVAAAALIGFVVAGVLDDEAGPAGTVELRAQLTGPSQNASATVRLLDIGREIDFATNDLPILPKGEYYELWFVGPNDTPAKPNRISAGTFHPDEQGRSVVTFTAAVDPAKYATLTVSAEPGDGDPRWVGRDVLRSAN